VYPTREPAKSGRLLTIHFAAAIDSLADSRSNRIAASTRNSPEPGKTVEFVTS
jgi:hypothetical protein